MNDMLCIYTDHVCLCVFYHVVTMLYVCINAGKRTVCMYDMCVCVCYHVVAKLFLRMYYKRIPCAQMMQAYIYTDRVCVINLSYCCYAMCVCVKCSKNDGTTKYKYASIDSMHIRILCVCIIKLLCRICVNGATNFKEEKTLICKVMYKLLIG